MAKEGHTPTGISQLCRTLKARSELQHKDLPLIEKSVSLIEEPRKVMRPSYNSSETLALK